ncbi:MAG: hypothetical protein ACREJL_08255 [Candidatus Methylomirabilales bacterium]
MRWAIPLLLASLLLGAGACSVPWLGDREVQEWRGQIVELNRDRGYIVVRSQERLLDYVFRLTSKTEIIAQGPARRSLEPGQWVTVQYEKDRSADGPPAALRVQVIR